MTCRCVSRIRIWPCRRDERSGVLIGAGGTRRSDWPEHMCSITRSLKAATKSAKTNSVEQSFFFLFFMNTFFIAF